ncbi:protein-methionine-sulfoxide reductase heme-binding subunit MsrQ [Yoonia sediminilitoris]|uniref:Protein-methionine-sulfoxide reductase heme-binding subunit MsrQ n=1 Tax=Yoonia sediminilitoris TaxID=1286148 RepID=A0A2T6K8I7_9RHOB|nr:protein-methionine-sulfoxide reductase heme-binding subunit MsrQ [Yoonia sediminilitoris]PUB11020.1 sulfoxide reductase heme-binding subunit YedZ [Yoonia sediminilitoris]RCW90939.1 sulfoxide reductase heme-binding subunit YedZ [Yoonia sediminilitoris]
MTLTQSINGALRRVPAWPIYVAVAVYVVWQFYLAATQTGRYLVEPINALEREYGETALTLLVAGLMVTPLRNWTGVTLLKFRRAIGVNTFFLVVAHLLVWVVLDVQSLERVWTEIVKRPYVTVGMASFLMLLPLALTSNNLSIRKLGAAGWRQLHRLTYPAAVLAGVHYLWLVKGFQLEPIIYMGVIVGLIVARVKWQRRHVTT